MKFSTQYIRKLHSSTNKKKIESHDFHLNEIALAYKRQVSFETEMETFSQALVGLICENLQSLVLSDRDACNMPNKFGTEFDLPTNLYRIAVPNDVKTEWRTELAVVKGFIYTNSIHVSTRFTRTVERWHNFNIWHVI